MKKLFFILSRIAVLSVCSNALADTPSPSEEVTKPNIVIFYVDDLGYGDLSAYGAESVTTAHVDKLAANGIKFTDAHSSAATCTPSRYSLLTGEHAFRENVRILKGDAAMVISPEQPTLPKLLKKAGYTTGVVGKWHLGLGADTAPVDWNEDVKPGPLEIGFDYSFLIPATGDRVPSVYLENHNVVNLDKNDPLYVDYNKKIGNRPTGYERPDLLRQQADSQHSQSIINGVSRIGWMAGGKSAEWVDEDFSTVTTEKANTFISDNKNTPFFLFFSFHDIHVPRLPNDRFKGATNMGVRGDAIVQMDWITGQVVEHLKANNLLNNTLIIFTSDNGAVLTDGYDDDALTLIGEHKANGPFKGGKYSAYEAGTRVPFIVHYPSKINTGVSDSLISQIDIYASIADLLDLTLDEKEAIDSENYLPALFNPNLPARKTLIEETPHTLSLRSGSYKYIRATDKNASFVVKKKNIDPGTMNTPQLFNLVSDIHEDMNLAKKLPQKVNEMEQIMRGIEARQTRLESGAATREIN
ncbi:arylsulfatase [Paraglaciecola agarilytica]|uniref:sulfatase family protein n=1 Tax=Paraglaciecola chathamensis TaxID=368405 RepID=UPI001C095BA2|nr:arylsulfatase [Paraglaciecola agarilytica]MBU3017977.1 arylsulfatase [Paraglaciecola agarilytica]